MQSFIQDILIILQHVQRVILQMKRQKIVFHVREVNTAKIVDIAVSAREMNGRTMHEIMQLHTVKISITARRKKGT